MKKVLLHSIFITSSLSEKIQSINETELLDSFPNFECSMSDHTEKPQNGVSGWMKNNPRDRNLHKKKWKEKSNKGRKKPQTKKGS